VFLLIWAVQLRIVMKTANYTGKKYILASFVQEMGGETEN
jgi:hypothetical protein